MFGRSAEIVVSLSVMICETGLFSYPARPIITIIKTYPNVRHTQIIKTSGYQGFDCLRHKPPPPKFTANPIAKLDIAMLDGRGMLLVGRHNATATNRLIRPFGHYGIDFRSGKDITYHIKTFVDRSVGRPTSMRSYIRIRRIFVKSLCVVFPPRPKYQSRCFNLMSA